jgi:hypothetical protein
LEGAQDRKDGGESGELLTCGRENLSQPEPGRRRARATRLPGGGGASSAQAGSDAASRDGAARARGKAPPLLACGPKEPAARTPRPRRRRCRPGGFAAFGPDGPCGLAAGPERRETGWVGPLARPNPVDRFFSLFFSFFSAKTIPGNAQKMFRGTKNTQKITKIPGKFLEID